MQQIKGDYIMNLQQAYYEQKFENEFLKTKGDAFQEFFEKLMGFAYKADFMACRPWGRQGDHKNDGFLKSERRLFQVYAPNEMAAKKAVDKINEDFEGAKTHWKNDFDSWVFAHNAIDGLPPDVLHCLLELAKTNPNIKLEHWGLEEFRVVFRRLSDDDLQTWFGPAPTEETKLKVGFKDLQIVLETLAGQTSSIPQEVRNVPKGKIEANALSNNVAKLIKEGMVKAPLVEEFFCQWHDQTLGERLAKSFKTQYLNMKPCFTPNAIFSEMQSWAGGNARGTPEHELAVVIVIAYFFERCDIFEEPRDSAS
jgi:hypothetical protein